MKASNWICTEHIYFNYDKVLSYEQKQNPLSSLTCAKFSSLLSYDSLKEQIYMLRASNSVQPIKMFFSYLTLNSKSFIPGHLIFQLRHRVADYQKRNKRTRAVSQDDLRNHQSDQRHTNVEMLPYLLELNVRGK